MSEGLRSISTLVQIETNSFGYLTKGVVLNNFATGEDVIAEGHQVNALYLILASKAQTFSNKPDSSRQKVATAYPGVIASMNFPYSVASQTWSQSEPLKIFKSW